MSLDFASKEIVANLLKVKIAEAAVRIKNCEKDLKMRRRMLADANELFALTQNKLKDSKTELQGLEEALDNL